MADQAIERIAALLQHTCTLLEQGDPLAARSAVHLAVSGLALQAVVLADGAAFRLTDPPATAQESIRKVWTEALGWTPDPITEDANQFMADLGAVALTSTRTSQPE